MKEIEEGIAKLHAKAREDGVQQTVVTNTKSTSPTPVSSSDIEQDPYSDLKAFAIVNSVAQISPAFHAGMLEGDKIVRFGSIDLAAGGLSKVSSQVKENEEMVVVVRRRNAEGAESTLELSLKPSKWAGPGLLGCHILPITPE